MVDVKEILMGILVLIYGIMFYIVGRTNLLEKFVLKLNKMIEDDTKPNEDMRKEDDGKMKNLKCEDCAFFDELDTEQPCCGCVDFVNFERDHTTEKGGAEE